MLPTYTSDVLIIGGGTAALRAAVAAAEAGADTLVMQKGPPNLGIVAFNAPVPDAGDTPEQFFNDMVIRGHFLTDYELAARLTHEALDEVRYLEAHGLSFTHSAGSYAPRLTSGNSVARTIYTTDRTGPQILSLLKRILRQRNIPIFVNKQAIQLLMQDQRVIGVLGVDLKTAKLEIHMAKAVILATGGLGPLYTISNNDPHLSGDGYILAYQAGAELIDMEFVQFEPFVLRLPSSRESFSISFLLDDNPRIYDRNGREFLPKRAAELGKDQLSRALFTQIQSGRGTPHGGVYFDVTRVPRQKLEIQERFLAFCRRVGLDPFTQPLEVGPSQHYMLGGVRIDEKAQTNLEGLFAAGEAAGGVHGADRLAGNSGTDVLVYGARAGRFAADYARRAAPFELTDTRVESAYQALNRYSGKPWDTDEFDEVSKRLRQVMWEHAGVIREDQGLRIAIETVRSLIQRARNLGANDLWQQVRLVELEGKLSLAEMICHGALLRKESRGVHFRSDYPERYDMTWLKHIIYQRGDDGFHTCYLKPSYIVEVIR